MTPRPAKVSALRKLLWLAAAVAAALALWSFLHGRQRPPNLLLVTFDTTRADRTGCYGYARDTSPNLDRLAARGLLFTAAEAPAPLTLPSHASMLTGLYPAGHGLRDNGAGSLPAGVETLAAQLKEAGYATAAFVSAEPLEARYGLGRGFDHYDDDLAGAAGRPAAQRGGDPAVAGAGTYGYDPAAGYGYGEDPPYGGARLRLSERPAAATVARATAWLEQPRGGRPFFLWVHFFEPHLPYQPAPDFAALFDQPYDAEVRTADQQLGALLKHLEAAGQLERTAVLVTADHGEGLGDHGEPTHALLTYRSTLAVPLVLALPPGLEAKLDAPPGGSRCAQPTSLVAVAPTLARLGGARPPSAGAGGPDLIELAAGRQPAAAVLGESHYGWRNFRWAPLWTLRSGDLRLVAGARSELFDIAADPGETSDLAASRPQDLARLEQELEERLAAATAALAAIAPGSGAPPVGDLGPYVVPPGQPPAAPPATPRAQLRDPRDALALAAAFDRLKVELGSRRYRSARDQAEKLLAEDGGNPFLLVLLARACKGAGDLEAALSIFRRAAAAGGGPEIQAGILDVRILRLAAPAAGAAAPADDSLEALAADADAYLLGAADSAALLFNRGRIHRMQGSLPAAADSFRRALALGYEHARAALIDALIDLGDRQVALQLLVEARGAEAAIAKVRERMVAGALARGAEAEQSGELEQALYSYTYAAEAEEKSLEAHTGLVRVQLRRRETEKALLHAIKASRLAPRDAEVLVQLAETLLHCGRADEARDTLKSLLELQPGHRRAGELLDQLEGTR